jgi:hypothetical protein
VDKLTITLEREFEGPKGTHRISKSETLIVAIDSKKFNGIGDACEKTYIELKASLDTQEAFVRWGIPEQ